MHTTSTRSSFAPRSPDVSTSARPTPNSRDEAHTSCVKWPAHQTGTGHSVSRSTQRSRIEAFREKSDARVEYSTSTILLQVALKYLAPALSTLDWPEKSYLACSEYQAATSSSTQRSTAAGSAPVSPRASAAVSHLHAMFSPAQCPLPNALGSRSANEADQ